MPDVCPSERRALALSQHDCMEGPSVKVTVIILNSLVFHAVCA